MLCLFIIIYISLKRSISRHSLSKKYCIYNCLAVNSITDCRNKIFIFLPVIICKIKHNTTIIGSSHIVTAVSVHSFEILCIFRIQQSHINLTGLQLYCLCIIVLYNLKNHLIDFGTAKIVIFIFCHYNRLPCIPAFQFIRTCTYRMPEKV